MAGYENGIPPAGTQVTGKVESVSIQQREVSEIGNGQVNSVSISRSEKTDQLVNAVSAVSISRSEKTEQLVNAVSAVSISKKNIDSPEAFSVLYLKEDSGTAINLSMFI